MIDFSSAINGLSDNVAATLSTNAIPLLGIVGIVGAALFVFALVRKTVKGR